ncbi:ABC transporter ATP-binding protein [Salinarimonas ramus]|uniref:ABC transporter ATP-binding protein n=1 Tax=Salinarimonas ramus TaxID=690164 RepID=A0A917Q4M4_9HYPH|nr:sn-glycerol-3-phosphate ABC transporter ATP-binding protein UgpC [Salinarimonas ramus]GGK21832.1 ABC transporter ATP-binding protein [Salinarimonas ramus]
MATIELRDIRKSYSDVAVIHDISLTVEDGSFVVLVGPSGCGKSTLLRMIAGLEEISGGELVIDGKVANHEGAADRGLAMVFQSYALYPHMTVYQNMSFGLENTSMPKAEIDQRVRRAAEMLRITDYLKRRPKALSGGQRQRVAIGRAIVRDPKAFLFDEPLSNLDAELRVAMRKELAALHREIDATMVYVTHDQVEAMTLADKIVVLNAGRVEQIGAPLDLYNKPANRFVAGFIGSPKMNMLEGALAERVTGGSVVALDGGHRLVLPFEVPGLSQGQRLTVGVRPEHVDIAAPGTDAPLAASVDINEQLGGETYLYCTLPGQEPVTVHQPGQRNVRHGDPVGLSVRSASVHLFAPDGSVVAHGADHAPADALAAAAH